MLQVSVKGCGNRRARQTDAEADNSRKGGAMSSKQLIDIIVKIGIEDVFTDDPVGKESDDSRLAYHQDLDGAWSDRLYCAPRRTQSAIGLYAYEGDALVEHLRRLYPLLRDLIQRNVMEIAYYETTLGSLRSTQPTQFAMTTKYITRSGY